MLKCYLFFITLLLGVGGLAAQITLTIDNFGPLDSIFLQDTLRISNEIRSDPPVGGADRVWDYSAVEADSILLSRPTLLGQDTTFAGATYTVGSTRSFQSFVFPTVLYFGTTEEGRFGFGQTSPGAKFPLLNITGGATDTLTFLPYRAPYVSPVTRLPMSFGDSFVDTTGTVLPFELSVASSGLNRTPGQQIEVTQRHTDVIGYGTLILPQPGGGVTEPLDVLLVKDSVFSSRTYTLGGAPAPAQLLAAFGLQEVNTDADIAYTFYVKGLGRSAASFATPGVDTTNFRFRFRRIPPGTTTATRRREVARLALYPNPVHPGDVLHLSGQTELVAGTVRLIDVQGRVVAEQVFDATGSGRVELIVPTSVKTGLYFYRLTDRSGRPVGIGKVKVR